MTGRRRIAPALWFVAPALGLIGVFFLVPGVASLVLSFTDFDIYPIADARHLRLAGADNYGTLLRDPRFCTALRHTLYFVLGGDPLSVAVVLGAALRLSARLARVRG